MHDVRQPEDRLGRGIEAHQPVAYRHVSTGEHILGQPLRVVQDGAGLLHTARGKPRSFCGLCCVRLLPAPSTVSRSSATRSDTSGASLRNSAFCSSVEALRVAAVATNRRTSSNGRGSVRARAKDAGMSNSVDTFEPGAVRIWRAERDAKLSKSVRFQPIQHYVEYGWQEEKTNLPLSVPTIATRHEKRSRVA